MQVFLVIITITLAVGFLARQTYQRFFKKDGNCEGCAVNKASKV